MKVGNTINGLKVTDVKRVNKLNLIQFLKEVDNYLQQGYQIDVNSARQVGLVLMADVFKVEQPFGSIGSVGDQTPAESVSDSSKEAEPVSEDTSVPEPQSVQSTNVEDTVEPELETAKIEETSVEATGQSVEAVVKEEVVVSPKKTTTRSKKTTQ